MTPYDDDRLTPEQDRVRAVLLALPAAEANTEFRTRLRAQFISGALAEQQPAIVPLPARAGPAWLGAALAVAAGLVLGVMLFNQGPIWQIARVRGEGTVLVGDRMLSMRDVGNLSAALARGGRVRLPADAEMDLVAPGAIAMTLSPGSDVDVPPAPGRWFQRIAHVVVRAGETYITTGRRFHGAHLTVATDEARVEVVGTTFAVLRHEEGTCVCVMEGKVLVGAVGEAPVEVGAGVRRFCYPRALGLPSESAPILESSEHALHALRSSTTRLLER